MASASPKRRRAGMRVILPQPHMIFRFTKPQDSDLFDDDVVGDSSETSPDHNPCKKHNHSQSVPEQNGKKSSNDSSGCTRMSYFDCNLCFKSERQPVVTACGHLFCHSCLCDWLEFSRKCPVCEAELFDGRIFPIYQCSGPRSKNYATK